MAPLFDYLTHGQSAAGASRQVICGTKYKESCGE